MPGVWRRARRLAPVLLVLAACTAPEYSREGATDEQRRRDEALCRAQVDELMVKERGIVADREATLGATDERLGRTRLRRDMTTRDDRNRSNRLMKNCMAARGWTASSHGLF